MVDTKTKARFIELRAQGWSYQRIAKDLKVAKQTVIDWGRELQGEVNSLRAVELEALRERYGLLQEHRVKTFGETLEAIRAELATRKLESLETDKLLELQAKYLRLFKEEPELEFMSSAEIAEAKTLESWGSLRPGK
jgi:transposase